MDLSRKRGSSRSAPDRRRAGKRIRTEEVQDDSFTADQKSIIAQAASAFNLSSASVAAAIADLQKSRMNKPPTPRRGKPRPEGRSKMPRELEKPDERDVRDQQSQFNQHKTAKSPSYNSTKLEMPPAMPDDSHEQRSRAGPGSSVFDDCFGFKILPSMLADCFASSAFGDQDSSYEQRLGAINQNSLVSYNDALFPSERNSNNFSASMNPNAEGLFYHKSYNQLIQPQQSFACDDPYLMDPYMEFALSHYQTLQAEQPMDNFPSMSYPPFDSDLPNSANFNSSNESSSYYSGKFPWSESEESSFLSAADETQHRSSASSEPEGNHSPIRPKTNRGPVDRVQTAQTRQLAACVRCKMQRIRCVPDPVDLKGVCITCKKVSKMKVSKIPCLRYRITDARLFKQGYLPGHVWTTRFQTMELNDIDNWDSPEVKTIQITYDYSDRPLTLQVRQFKPHEGDMLHRSWKHGSVKKSVLLPPYAIASFEAAEKMYQDYINQDGPKFFVSTIDKSNRLLWETMSAAIKASNHAMTEPERVLLKMILRLWVAGRFICRSERICGSDTLGLPSDLIDETNPWLHGKIPIPPVMGAQIDLIVTSRILNPLRAAILEKLQKIILVNKPQNWFCVYLCIFVLLHNCALVTQQDTAYARKHGLKTQFAMVDLIGELHTGANILLAYFHYCTKGFRPFSLDWKEEKTLSMAELNTEQIEFVKKTAAYVKANESRFRDIFEKEKYDDDLYFVAQMYEEDWKPRTTKLDSLADQ